MPHDVGDEKIARVLGEFKRKRLRSGKGKGGKPGKVVTDRKQALAIAISASRTARRMKDGT